MSTMEQSRGQKRKSPPERKQTCSLERTRNTPFSGPHRHNVMENVSYTVSYYCLDFDIGIKLTHSTIGGVGPGWDQHQLADMPTH